MIARVSKITRIEGHTIHCTFNYDEHRVVDLRKFVEDHGLTDNKDLAFLLDQDNLQAEVKDRTISFPQRKKRIELKNGKQFEVDFDLDPIMLYESSTVDHDAKTEENIGLQLKAARKAAGLTQEKLAERVGTSKGYISRIENNRADITLKTLRRIVEVGLNKRIMIVD